MFKRRTLFVIGAGASREADLPCGDDLALKISEKLDIRYDAGFHIGHGDKALFEAVKAARRGNPQQLLQAAWLIRDGIHLSNSVDEFLERHNDNLEAVFLAKTTIAKCILDAERNSKLWYDDSNTYNFINFP